MRAQPTFLLCIALLGSGFCSGCNGSVDGNPGDRPVTPYDEREPADVEGDEGQSDADSAGGDNPGGPAANDGDAGVEDGDAGFPPDAGVKVDAGTTQDAGTSSTDAGVVVVPTDDMMEKLTAPQTFAFTHVATAPSLLNGIASRLTRATVASVLADGNRTARPGCVTSALPLAPVSERHFCWDPVDTADTNWMPQGITTSADASATGTVGGQRAILTSWANVNSNPVINENVRIAFVNDTNPQNITYRFVYLVEPFLDGSGALQIRAAKGHGGGIAWYGDMLYVVDVYNGIRVFDMRRIYVAGTTNAMGCTAATCHAYAYKYLMPQVALYRPVNRGGPTRPDNCRVNLSLVIDRYKTPMCHSTLSIDRSGASPSLILGEYRSWIAGSRILRLALGSAGLPTQNIQASEAWWARKGKDAHHTISDIQGVVVDSGTLILGRSKSDQHGKLWVVRPGESTSSPSCTRSAYDKENWGNKQCWSVNAESMSSDRTTGLVWSITEKPAFAAGGNASARVVFAVRRPAPR